MNPQPAAFKAIESLTASTEARRAGQRAAYTHKLAVQAFFDEKVQTDATLDLSPEYQQTNLKASKRNQIDAMNIKKTQSLKRMMLENYISGASPDA